MYKHGISIKFVLMLAFSRFIMGCGAGTLGGLEERSFLLSKQKLEIAIDSLYSQYPGYKIPTKWEPFNDWSKRGYDFLESRIFYFASAPEEMYYVSFVGEYSSPADTFKSIIAVRSVFKGSDNKWLLEKDLDSEERRRIEKRFDDEIISKLERYTKLKAEKE